MNNDVLVSICCLAYNHEKYIRQCLDGFMMQKTNFKFEVLIHDDASTDKTADIIREYEQKYPDIIKPIYQTENQYSKGNSVSKLNRSRATGKYVALCEGDDYWTDPYKLQKQVDFMDANPEYSVCFHDVKVIYEPKIKEDYVFPDAEIRKKCPEFNFENLLNNNFIQTNSVMYRASSYPEFWKDIPSKITPLDWYVHLMFASKGKIKYMPETMSVYRRNPGGVWYDRIKNISRFYIKETNMYYNVYKYLATDKKKYFKECFFPFFMFEQYYILSSKNFTLWFKYNIVYFKIYLLLIKYWQVIPTLIFSTTCRLLKKLYKNIFMSQE